MKFAAGWGMKFVGGWGLGMLQVLRCGARTRLQLDQIVQPVRDVGSQGRRNRSHEGTGPAVMRGGWGVELEGGGGGFLLGAGAQRCMCGGGGGGGGGDYLFDEGGVCGKLDRHSPTHIDSS